MKKYNKITIVGMGLMGGSLGREILKKKIAKNVTGLGRNPAKLRKALKKKAATHVTTDMEEAAAGADLIILSVPVMLIPGMFASILPYAEKNTIITDMGSVKAGIEKKIRKYDINRCFIGSHPMVGSEKTGINNSRHDLYSGGVCIIAGGTAGPAGMAKVSSFWERLGMKVMKMTPMQHDKLVSGISHFPHLMSFLMINTKKNVIANNPRAIGKGFRDTTRIAASGEEIWSDIFISNKNMIIKDIKQARKELLKIKKMIVFNRSGALKAYIKKARVLRERLD